MNFQVKDVKDKIQAEKGVEAFPVEKQKLIYNGKVLENADPLSKYEINEKKFLVVMVPKPQAAPAKPAASTPTEAASKPEAAASEKKEEKMEVDKKEDVKEPEKKEEEKKKESSTPTTPSAAPQVEKLALTLLILSWEKITIAWYRTSWTWDMEEMR